jgi:hypothetical protein
MNENETNLIRVNSLVKRERENILKDENNFFKKLDDVMSDHVFKSFYDEYFRNFTDIKTVIMYMKLYESLTNVYKINMNQDMPKELLVNTMKNIMEEKDLRRSTVQSFQTFVESNKQNLDLFQIEQKYIENVKKEN